MLPSFSLPSDLATCWSPVFTPDCKDHEVHQGFLHARRQNLKKAPICRTGGVAGMTLVGPRCPVLSRALCRTCTVFLKTSRMAVEQRLMGQLTRTHNTYWQSVFMQDIVKCNLWTLIAEQNVPYGHYSCNHMELQHK